MATSPRGLGIPNVGNTCYVNSWLHALWPTGAYGAACAALRGRPRDPVVSALCGVVMDPRSEAAGRRLALALESASPEFALGSQSDAHEFGMMATARLHIERSGGGWGESDVSDRLRGAVEHVTQCGACGAEWRSSEEPLWDLPVPVPDTLQVVDLAECIARALAPADAASARCPECGAASPGTQRRTDVTEHPEFLVIHLLRFDASGQKLHTRVRMHGHRADVAGVEYEAVATVVHAGTADGGHYVANVVDQGGAWWRVDDGDAHRIDRTGAFEGDVYIAVLQAR